MTRGKQYVKKRSLVYWRGKKKARLPIGLLASIGVPILGEIAKPIFGKIFGRGRRRSRRCRRKR